MKGAGSDGHDVLFLGGYQIVNLLDVLVRELLDLRFQVPLAVFRDDVVRLELFGGVHAILAGAAHAHADAGLEALDLLALALLGVQEHLAEDGARVVRDPEGHKR